MLKYDNTVSSTATGQPIYGAQVAVYEVDANNNNGAQAALYADEAGTMPLSQPILTDQAGYFAFYIGDGKYNISVMTGTVEISRTNITMVDSLQLKQRALLVPVNEDSGTLPSADARAGMLLGFDATDGSPTALAPNSFPGPTGPADNTYTSYAAMQASDPTRKSARLVGDTDVPPHPDGPYNNPTQTVGGWIAQPADGIAYTANAQPPAVPKTDVNDRLDRDPYLTSLGVPVDGRAVNTSLANALAQFDTSGGAGARVVTPKGRLRLSGSKLVMRDRLVLEGQAIRAAIVGVGVDSNGNGSGFLFDGLEHAGLRRMRVGLDGASGLVAIEVKATNSDARTHIFENLEIAGASIANQIGMRFTRTGDPILSENITENVILTNIDQPIIDLDSEGNFRKVIIDGFAYGAPQVGINARTHANLDIARIARANTAGSTAYRQAGTRNIAILYTDLGPTIGPQSNALDVTGQDNMILLQRPEGSTRLGSWAPGNMVLDGANAYPRRTMTRGTGLIGGNFTLTGWGSAASVSVSKGDDQSGRIVVMAAGTGMTANPTVALTYADGAWPFTPKVLIVQRGGGNQPTADQFVGRNVGTGSWNFRPLLTPVDGEAYEFDYLVG